MSQSNQIKGKYIKNNAISGSKILILNDEPLRALKANGTEQELLKLDNLDQLVFIKIPKVSSDAVDGNELVRKSQVDSLLSAETLARSNADTANLQEAKNYADASILVEKNRAEGVEASLQTQITTEKGRVDAILSAADADKDSFAEIVQLINSVDLTNDNALASAISNLQSNIDAEAATRALEDAKKVNKSGDTMTGTLNIRSGSEDIITLNASTKTLSVQDLVQLKSTILQPGKLVASQIDPVSEEYLAITNIEPGVISLQSPEGVPATPSANDHVTTKKYVDDSDATKLLEAKNYADTKDSEKLLESKNYADAAVLVEKTRAEGVESGLQSQINVEKGRVDAILDASQADKDSFAEIVQLINSIDLENDNSLASAILTEQNARIAGDSANLTKIELLENFARAQTIWVSKNGSDTTGTGGEHKPYLTLSKAFSMITDASPSKRYVVRVSAGAYTESSVALPSNVFVVGESKESVRISGAVSMGAWTQNNSGSDDRSGFSNVSLLSAANFNWDTAKSRAGKLYMNEVVFASTLNMYGYDNAIAQAQFDSCVIFGAITISGINVGVFNNNVCFNNINLNQHPNGGMATILTASGGYCSGTVRHTTTVSDFNRRAASFLRAFPSENLIVDGPSSYADVDLISGSKQGAQKLNGGNLVPLTPIISHDLTAQMIVPRNTNSHNMGDWGKQWMWNFGYVHASTGTDLFLISYPESYGLDSSGKSVNIIADGAGLQNNVNGGDINLQTSSVSGTGVRGKITLDAKEIDVTNKQIKNVATGTDPNDAVNKAQLDAVASTAVQFVKERKVVDAGMLSAGYIDLQFQAKANSINFFVDRLVMHQDVDYSVSVVGGVTRITFLDPMLEPSPEALAIDDNININYAK